MYTVREAAAAVRELRENGGYTQAELAQRARLSRSFVADVERGKARVEAAKLFDLFQALGFEVALRENESGDFRR